LPVSDDGTKVTGPQQSLTSFPDNVTQVSAALNGRMACSVSAIKNHLWGVPIDRRGQATGEPKQMTNGFAGEEQPSLSGDGGKLAFLSWRANGNRLFYRDLATGREKELSADGGNNWHALFTPNGNGVISARDKSLEYLPLSGGLPKTIWDKSAFLWDLSPDGNTLLFFTTGDPNKPRFGVVRELDLASGSTTTLLDDPELEMWNAHFSHDGHWVVFNATKDPESSHIYVVPFRKAFVPRSQWIAITNGDWDDKPRFSFEDKVVFFVSGHAAPYRIWAQRLGPDMHPDGKPFAVYPGQVASAPAISHDPNPKAASTDILVGPNLIIFTHDEATGNIWLMEPAKKGAH
jgi:hypothetical protein